jgi:hypothetical protein
LYACCGLWVVGSSYYSLPVVEWIDFAGDTGYLRFVCGGPLMISTTRQRVAKEFPREQQE